MSEGAVQSDCSRAELQAVFIARQISDGEQVLAGTNLEVPRAALLLAHWHHAPNLRIQLGAYMAVELERWGKVVKDAGIKLE